MSFNSFAPVLSAQTSLDPIGRPRAILGRYSTIPLALTALVFGAGILGGGSSSFFDYDKVDFFAQWSALGYRHLVTFNGCDARWVMGNHFAGPPLVLTVVRAVLRVTSANQDSLVSFGGGFSILEYAS